MSNCRRKIKFLSSLHSLFSPFPLLPLHSLLLTSFYMLFHFLHVYEYDKQSFQNLMIKNWNEKIKKKVSNLNFILTLKQFSRIKKKSTFLTSHLLFSFFLSLFYLIYFLSFFCCSIFLIFFLSNFLYLFIYLFEATSYDQLNMTNQVLWVWPA